MFDKDQYQEETELEGALKFAVIWGILVHFLSLKM